MSISVSHEREAQGRTAANLESEIPRPLFHEIVSSPIEDADVSIRHNDNSERFLTYDTLKSFHCLSHH